MDSNLLQEIKAGIVEVVEERDALLLREENLLKEKKAADEFLTCAKEAQAILSSVAKETQADIEDHLTNIVTIALAAVESDDSSIPKPPEFVARVVERRNTIECDLMFKEGKREQHPKECSGFGYVDIADYALRVDFILLELEYSDENIRKTLVLDEPFRFVDPSLQYKVSEMLNMVSDDLGFQQIVVSHAKGVNKNADTTHKITKVGKHSKVVTA